MHTELLPSGQARIRNIPASRGGRWVVDGFFLVWRAPVLLLASTILLLLTAMVLSAPEGLHLYLTATAAPALQFGFTEIARAVDRKDKATPLLLYSGMNFSKDGLRASGLICTGALIYVIGFALALTFTLPGEPSTTIKDSTPDRAHSESAVNKASPNENDRPGLGMAQLSERNSDPSSIEEVPPPPNENRDFWRKVGEALTPVFSFALTALWWYAPHYAGYHRAGPFRSLYLSAITIWRIRWAFAIFVLVWSSVAWTIYSVAMLTADTFGKPGLLLAVPLMVVGIAAIYSSSWSSFRDLIEPDEDSPRASAP